MKFIEAFQRGEMVEVIGEEDVWVSRIFVTRIEGAKRPYVCVSNGYEDDFHRGKPFVTVSWRNCRKKSTVW